MGMIRTFLRNLDWRRTYALTVVYGYMYQIIVWPYLFWGTTILTLWTGNQWPAPPIIPWEQLVAATANLAVVGTVQLLRDREHTKLGMHGSPL